MESNKRNQHRLRTNSKMALMREKAMLEEKKRRIIFNNNYNKTWSTSSKVYNPQNIIYSQSTDLFSSNNPHLSTHSLPTANNNFIIGSTSFHDNIDGFSISPSNNSITPSSATNSISEFDALCEGMSEQASVTFSEQIQKSMLNEVGSTNKESMKTSTSCPSIRHNLPTKLDPNDFPDLESYKKEKHNIVEKKRRYKINDCIQELAQLLPAYYDVDLNNNKKGYVLEKTVDYVKSLSRDQNKVIEFERKNKDLEKQNKILMLQIQAMKLEKSQQQHQNYLLCAPTNQNDPANFTPITSNQSTPNQTTIDQTLDLQLFGPQDLDNNYVDINNNKFYDFAPFHLQNSIKNSPYITPMMNTPIKEEPETIEINAQQAFNETELIMSELDEGVDGEIIGLEELLEGSGTLDMTDMLSC